MSLSLVTVEKYQFLPQAEAARLAMAAEGLDAVLADKETVSTDWALGNAVGYIKLQVPSDQAESAYTILREMRERREARSTDLDPSDPGQCLSCNTPFLPNQSTCPKCGWSFASDVTDADKALDTDDMANSPATTTVTDSLIALKRPMVLMLLLPVGLAFAALALVLLAWICNLIV